jgi:KaiC/GvpD/RAD55 family RecA-like ATPase
VASRPYLVKGFIGQRDVACVIGAPGVGKSVFAPDLAYAVAQGREFHGRRVKRGKVFYVAAEDHHGMQTRLTALLDRYGDAEDLTLVGGVSDLLNPDKNSMWSPHMRVLAEAVKAEKPSMVVIDTLAMSFPGLEENNAEGMGRVMAVARKLTQWGAAVLLVHHDTKDGSNGLPRGHSLLNGALDVSLHLTRATSGVVSGRLTKNRNGGTDLELAFRIRGAEIGIDEDGDPITAAIADPVAPGSDETEDRLPPAQSAALASILGMMPEDSSGVDAAEWKRAAQDDDRITSAEKPDARRRAVSQALTNLLRRGKVTISDGRIHLPEPNFASLLDDLEDQNAGED